MLLSVLSALARLDLDPWQETASLDRLPRTTATERLTGLIAALPDEFSVHRDPAAIASRLITRLPSQHGGKAMTASNAPGFEVPAAIQAQTLFFLALVLMVLLGSLGLAGSHKAATHEGSASAPLASGIALQPPTTMGVQR